VPLEPMGGGEALGPGAPGTESRRSGGADDGDEVCKWRGPSVEPEQTEPLSGGRPFGSCSTPPGVPPLLRGL
jgi:hypothetical protein